MSRAGDLMARLENVARKLGMELEECLAVLEGKHPKLSVTEKDTAKVNPPIPAAPSAGGVQAENPAENPTTSGAAAASVAAQNQAAAGSTGSVGAEE